VLAATQSLGCAILFSRRCVSVAGVEEKLGQTIDDDVQGRDLQTFVVIVTAVHGMMLARMA
jgi:hypothetical protein